MASGDCTCCGMPTTVPAPVEIESECDHGCFDCTDCDECGYGECTDLVTVQPDVLCDGCKVGEVDGRCDPADTWHCDGRYGHSCDGTGCEERGAECARGVSTSGTPISSSSR